MSDPKKAVATTQLEQSRNLANEYFNRNIVGSFLKIPQNIKLTLLQNTPEKFIKKRKVGGMMIPYIDHFYAEKCLNFIFNFEVGCTIKSKEITEELYTSKAGKKGKKYETVVEVCFIFGSGENKIMREVIAGHTMYSSDATTKADAYKGAISKAWSIVARTFGVGSNLAEKEDRAYRDIENSSINADAQAESVPEITILLNDISKIDSLEKLNELQTGDLPNWANNYSGAELDKIAEMMKARREELEKGGGVGCAPASQPRAGRAEAEPPTKKQDDTAQNIENAFGEGKDLKGKGFEKKTPPAEEKPKKTKQKVAGKKLSVEELPETKNELAEKADALFDDEKISEEHAAKFQKFFEQAELDKKPWLARVGAKTIAGMTIEQGKLLKKIIQEEIK